MSLQTLKKSSTKPVDLYQVEQREKLAKIIMQLFDHWQLDSTMRLNLLGLSPNSRALLSKYQRGTSPLPATRDLLDRVGWLLAIHKALRLLYPKNEDVRYTWVKRRNTALNNLMPLEIMEQQGIIGLAKIARYLDYLRGQ